MKFRGKTFGNTARIEFEILTLGEIKIEDLRDFDVDTIKVEIKPTSSGLKLIGIWEGEIERAGEGIMRALEESHRLKERIINRMRSRVEKLRGILRNLGFKEEVVDYGSYLRFSKKVGGYELVVLVSTRTSNVRMEIYGGEKKVITPEIETLFEEVDVEELETYEFEEEPQERLVINIEIPEDDEKPENKIVEAIKIIENLLMV